MYSELTLEDWCSSRGLKKKDALRICSQLRAEYMHIGKALKGHPVPTVLLERDLISLVLDSQTGRFPVRHKPVSAKNVRPLV